MEREHERNRPTLCRGDRRVNNPVMGMYDVVATSIELVSDGVLHLGIGDW
jgi:hypothetical protein